MHAKKILSWTKIEETGFSVGNLQRQIIVEAEKISEMFECDDEDLRSLQVIEFGCNKHIDRELES